MKHRQTKSRIIGLPPALMAVLGAFAAVDPAFAADGVPAAGSGAQVTAVRSQGQVPQKRVFRPIVPISGLTRAVMDKVSPPVNQTDEDDAREALIPPMNLFTKTEPEVRIEPPPVPGPGETIEPQTLDYGYAETNPAVPTLSISPPANIEIESEGEPQPRQSAKSSTKSPSKSAGYSKATGFSRGRSSSGPACRT